MQRPLLCLLSAIIFAFGVSSVHSQVLYGTVIGDVTDSSGAAIEGATIIISNIGTGQNRESVSDTAGRYSVGTLVPGLYGITVTKPGFRTMTRDRLQVSANAVSRVEFELDLGQVTEQITVHADIAALRTEKADSGADISTTATAVLPMSSYRNYQALINLVPGATPAATQNSATDTPGRSLTTNINGTARNHNMTRVDGAINVNVWLPHHTAYVPPSETVETLNVSTGAFDAEQGMAGGSAITVVTKSGTNDFHGSAWEFHNNQRLRARSFFMPENQEKPRDTLNIFGATMGGPIVRNRLFCFGGFEATRQRTGGSGLFTVATADQRAGDFSSYISSNGQGRIYDPLTGSSNGSGRLPFSGNQVPVGRFSQAATRIMEYLPLPNQAGTAQNYFSSATGLLDRYNYDVKINWNRNDRHTIHGKYSSMLADVTGVGALGELIGPAVVNDPGAGHTFVQVPTLGHTYVFSANLLLDQSLGFVRTAQHVLGTDYGTNWGTEVFGIPGTNGSDIRQSGLPAFNFDVYSGIGQLATWMPTFRADQSYTHSTNLTWTKGAHELRFGFDMVRHQLNHWQPETQNPRGAFTFGGGVTALAGGASPNQYNSFAGFLLGMPSSEAKSLQHITLSGREWQFGWYARDRWQVNRSLTVNIGLRYELYPLMTRASSGIERLDVTTMQVYLGGRGNTPSDAGISVSKKMFAPRLGIAWRVNDRFVVRTGYGLTFDPLPLTRPLRGSFPYTIAASFPGANEYSSFGTLQQGIPAFGGPDVSSGVVPLPNNVESRFPGTSLDRGYIQSWNLTLEHKLPAGFIGSAGYVGTQTTRNIARLDLNAAAPGAGSAGRPFAQQFGRRVVTDLLNGYLSSNYHSLQTSLNRQFSGGLFVKGSYTYSKALNRVDDDGTGTVMWNWEGAFDRNYALAGYDRTHMLQMAWVWEMPFGKGKDFVNQGVAAAIVGGWSVNGVFSAYTGTPFTVSASGASLNAPGNSQTADQVKVDVEKIGDVGRGQYYYDPTAFAAVTGVRFGSTGRNILRAPGVVGADASVFRNFDITEKIRLEFRAEAFNVTNTPRFASPSANVAASNFMQVSSVVDGSDRQFRFGLKAVF